VTDAATPPGGKGQPAAAPEAQFTLSGCCKQPAEGRSAGEGGWGPFDAACGVAQDKL
jgi:hypothetical protein